MKRLFFLGLISAFIIQAANAESFFSATNPAADPRLEGFIAQTGPSPPISKSLDNWTYSTNAAILASPKLADLNGDGTDEILLTTYDVVNPYWGGWLYAWNGSGTVLPGFPIHLTGAPPGTPAIGDLDNDGDPEIVQGTWNYLYVFNHDGSAYPGWPQAMYVTQAAALADMDGDGDLEIIVPAYNMLQVYHHNGIMASGFPVCGNHDLTAASIGDLEGDGDLEIVAGTFFASGSATDYVHAWHHNGTPVTGFPVTTAGSVKAPPALGDLDGDGTLEIVADCWNLSGTDYLYVWSHTGALEPGWPINADYVRLSSPSIANLDLDAELEIVVGGWSTSPSGEKVYVFNMDGTPLTGFPVVLPNSPSGNVNSTCTLGNLDSDWYPEIVVKAVNNIFALNHTGAIVTGFPIFLDDTGHSGTTSPTPAIGDPDGDGHSEIFAASTYNTVMLIDQPGDDFPAAYRWPTFRQDPSNGGIINLPLTVTLDPINPPIVIPASGGNFRYHLTMANHTSSPQTFEGWLWVILPVGQVWDPILGPITLTLPANVTLERNRTQYVPAPAPAGNYTYISYIGDYPMPWQSDAFPFTKSAANNGGPQIDSWLNTGEPFDTSSEPFITHHSSLMTSVSPNPFNPATVLRYELPRASFVKLAVYNVSGRLVATLLDGWREAGVHEVTFDGSGLPSGIYIYRLTAGGFTASGKMILMK